MLKERNQELDLNPYQRPIVDTILKAYAKAKSRNWEKWYWALDIHDTIMEPSYSGTDITRKMFPEGPECLLKLSRRKDSRLIIYSSSTDDHLKMYREYFGSMGIVVDYVNENPDEPSTSYANFEKKMYFSVLLDDKAGFDPSVDFKAISFVLDHLPELTGNTKVFDIAATVARMHSPDGPHAGHDALITEMFNRGKKVLFFLSCDFVVSGRNPLSFEDRKYLLECAIKRLKFSDRDYSILALQNQEDNAYWSAVLDQQILLHAQKPTASEEMIALFHSRDGFGKHYEPYGRFPVLYVSEVKNVSATKIREQVVLKKYTDPAFFHGKVSQQLNQPALLLNQVRCIIRSEMGNYLLIKYAGHPKPSYRFLGGYFNPEKDVSLEVCLKRKIREKTNDDGGKPVKLIGVVPIQDWRYREARASIQCVIYGLPYQFSESDLIKNPTYRKLPEVMELCWVPQHVIIELLHPEERPILEFL